MLLKFLSWIVVALASYIVGVNFYLFNPFNLPEFEKEPLIKPANLTGSPKFYEVLGIPLFSSEKEIKTAYRRQIRLNHPDKVGESEKEQANLKTHQLSEAYKFLMSKERCWYDWNLGSGLGHYTDCQEKYIKEDADEFNAKMRAARQRRAKKAREEKLANDAKAGIVIKVGRNIRKKAQTVTRTAQVVVSECIAVAKWLLSFIGFS